MAGVSDKPPPPPSPGAPSPGAPDARTRREAELAEALRANLKRRKAPPATDSKAARPEQRDAAERADPPLPPPTRDG